MLDEQELGQMRSTLTKLKEQLVKYQEMYEEDEEVDSEERKNLDSKLLKVYKLEVELNKALGNNLDPIRWGEIAHEYGQEINSRIQEAMMASDRAKGYITQENESSGSMVISAMLSIIGSFGPPYAIGVEIYKAAANTLKADPPDNLTDFHRAWIAGLEKQKNKKTRYKNFKKFFYSKYLSGCTEDQVTHTTVLTVMKNYISGYFFTRPEMEQLYVHSWINSAQDSIMDWDAEAGYIQIQVRYQYPIVYPLSTNINMLEDGMWFKSYMYFDDMARPKGTNNALAGAYGSGKKISELPFKIKVNLQITFAPGIRRPNWTGTCFLERSKTGKWIVKMGPKMFLKPFIKGYFNKLTVKDLGVE